MRKKTLKYVALWACGVLALAELSAGTSASAGDNKGGKGPPAPSGVWTLKGGEAKIAFSNKDVLKIYPHGQSDAIVILCKYTVEKGGVVKATISEFEGKDEMIAKVKKVVPIGQKFNFKWKVKGDVATLEDLKGDKVEMLKSHLEGDYDRQKKTAGANRGRSGWHGLRPLVVWAATPNLTAG